MASSVKQLVPAVNKLVFGYIHEIEPFLPNNQIIPINIIQLCKQFYFVTRTTSTNDNEMNDESDDESDDERERILRFQIYGLTKSSQPDCIVGYDDDDEVDRADIGCPKHHSMAAETMYCYIIGILEKNVSATTIVCIYCKDALDWDICAQIADMNEKEYDQWTRIIDRRIKGPVKPCPFCKTENRRIQTNGTNLKMCCNECKNCWCWHCGQLWKTKRDIYCGNEDCSLIVDLNKCLSEAPLVTLVYLNNAQVPNVRSCPKCLTLMCLINASSFMVCIGCGKKFCFNCLEMYDEATNKWPCNSGICNVAPVQVFK